MSETTNNAEQAIQAQLRRLEWMIPDSQRRLAGVAQEMLRRAQKRGSRHGGHAGQPTLQHVLG